MEGFQARLEQQGLVKKVVAPRADAPAAVKSSTSVQSTVISAQLVHQHWKGASPTHPFEPRLSPQQISQSPPPLLEVIRHSWRGGRPNYCHRLPLLTIHAAHPDVDLDGKRKAWEESCLDIANAQEASSTSRKALAENTKGLVPLLCPPGPFKHASTLNNSARPGKRNRNISEVTFAGRVAADFRKKTDEEKLEGWGTFLKSYQAEIDSLTKRRHAPPQSKAKSLESRIQDLGPRWTLPHTKLRHALLPSNI